MLRFINNVLLAVVLVIFLLAGSLFLIPDYTARESALAAMPLKHRMLENASGPRIIFLGGSNLCFGLNSKRIADTFNLPVINMGLHAGIGLKYMMQDLDPFVRENDLIILSTEYTDFYTQQYYGNIELVSLLFDVDRSGLAKLTPFQWKKLIPSVFKYASIKLIKLPRIIQYYLSEEKINEEDIGYYNKYSFNEYGDTYMHWTMDNIPFAPYAFCDSTEKVSGSSIRDIILFANLVSSRGANLMILPPVLQETTFDGQAYIINEIAVVLDENELSYYRNPDYYRFADSLFFNTPYHLNKTGIEIRTSLVIEDIRSFIEVKGQLQHIQ